MLCFVQGFDGNKEDAAIVTKQTTNKEKLQTVKNKILRKSRYVFLRNKPFLYTF